MRVWAYACIIHARFLILVIGSQYITVIIVLE